MRAGIKRCTACRSEMPARATKCTKCQSSQTAMKSCEVCGESMPKRAKRCNKCTAFQGWRRHFVFAASLVSLGTAIAGGVAAYKPAASYIHDLTSHTKFKLMRATGDPARNDAALLYLNVWNTGRKPSAIVGYRLKLGRSPIEGLTFQEIPLERFPEDTNVIQPGAPVAIRLRTRELKLIQRGCRPYTKDEAIKLLASEDLRRWRVTLEVDVEESNDPREGHYWIQPRPFHQRSDSFPLESIVTFMKGSMSG